MQFSHSLCASVKCVFHLNSPWAGVFSWRIYHFCVHGSFRWNWFGAQWKYAKCGWTMKTVRTHMDATTHNVTSNLVHSHKHTLVDRRLRGLLIIKFLSVENVWQLESLFFIWPYFGRLHFLLLRPDKKVILTCTLSLLHRSLFSIHLLPLIVSDGVQLCVLKLWMLKYWIEYFLTNVFSSFRSQSHKWSKIHFRWNERRRGKS